MGRDPEQTKRTRAPLTGVNLGEQEISRAAVDPSRLLQRISPNILNEATLAEGASPDTRSVKHKQTPGSFVFRRNGSGEPAQFSNDLEAFVGPDARIDTSNTSGARPFPPGSRLERVYGSPARAITHPTRGGNSLPSTIIIDHPRTSKT